MTKSSDLNKGDNTINNTGFSHEEMYRQLAVNSPVGMLICDLDGTIIFANRRVVELMGSPSMEDTLRINLFDYPKIIETGAVDQIRHCIESGEDQSFQTHYVSKWGKDLWLNINVAPIYDKGAIQCFGIVLDDATSLIRQQEMVKENEQHYKVMFEHLPDAIWAMNREGIIRYVNQKACSDIGYEKHELLGLNIHHLDPDLEEGDFSVSFDYIANQGYMHHIGQSKHKNGHLIDIELHAVLMDFEEEQLVVCSTRNITERLMKEEELFLEKEKAEQANKAKTNFLSNMSHEIRTPINGLMGFLQMLKNTSLDQEQLEYLQWMKSSTDSLLRVIDDVLDMSKIDSGKMKIEERPFSVGELINDCFSVVKFKAMQSGIRLDQTVQPNLPGFVKGDRFRLQQVIVNLLDNAIKFTEPDGEVHLDIHVDAQDEQGLILGVVVKDTGIGIEPQQLERLFAPFEKNDLSLTRKYGGTGLGLTICRALTELMKGSISVKSEPGVGTEVYLTVPLELSIDESVYDRYQLQDNGRMIKKEAKVLVVDDCPVNRLLLTKMLEKDGVDYRSAENGNEALKLLENHVFNLIFMDCQLPDIDGYEVAKWIRQQEIGSDRRIRIVATTAYASESDRIKCIEAGMDDYMSKPLNLQAIRDNYRNTDQID